MLGEALKYYTTPEILEFNKIFQKNKKIKCNIFGIIFRDI